MTALPISPSYLIGRLNWSITQTIRKPRWQSGGGTVAFLNPVFDGVAISGALLGLKKSVPLTVVERLKSTSLHFGSAFVPGQSQSGRRRHASPGFCTPVAHAASRGQ